jgi:hypothetical protein
MTTAGYGESVWTAEAQYISRIWRAMYDAAPAEAAQGEVEAALQAAIHALRSYQYGNGAPDLAEEVADRCERALAPKAAQDKIPQESKP